MSEACLCQGTSLNVPWAPSFPRKLGRQPVLRSVPSKEPGHSQDEHPESRGRAQHSQGPSLPSHHFAESHSFPKDVTRPGGSITTVHGIHTSQADMGSLSPKGVSCCHLGALVAAPSAGVSSSFLSSMCKRPLRDTKPSADASQCLG